MGFETLRLGTDGGLRWKAYNEFGTTVEEVDTEPGRPELKAIHWSFREREGDCSPAIARDIAATFKRAADQADELAGRR